MLRRFFMWLRGYRRVGPKHTPSIPMMERRIRAARMQ